MYIAFSHNPQPQLVAQLEYLIGSDVHSTDPLLLAYGALIARASPELQQRMTSFLLQRLPHVQTQESSLIHHLHSLGNGGASHAASSIISYLQHPEKNVQLTAISALRFLANETEVQKALTELLSQPDVSEEHVIDVVSSLRYGVQNARENRVEKPYSSELATALVLAAMDQSNDELNSAVIKYLYAINTAEAKQLANILMEVEQTDTSKISNSTRVTRGTNWDERNSVYNLVEPQKVRKADEKKYSYRKSYIWGMKMGCKDANIQIAVGGLIGVSKKGEYKVFGHAVAEANAMGLKYTAVDTIVLREKTKSSTISVVYIMVGGKVLRNINEKQDSSVCKTFDKNLFKKKSFRLFKITHSIFVYVGTINFKVEGTIELTGSAFMEFCENTGSVTATAGLAPVLTFKISAGASANILVSIKY